MDSVLIPIVGMAIPIVIVPTAMAFKHARFLREVEHRERMRAMELGRLLPEDEANSPTRLAQGIGIGVPLGAMALAWLAGMSTHVDSEPIWMASGMIGLGGLICGTILAIRHAATRGRHAAPYADPAKPEYDPDAFDVVGRRG